MSRAPSKQVRQLLDGALDGALDAPARAHLSDLLRADPGLRESFASERRVLAALKDVELPRDLTEPILSRVQRRRAFLSRSARMRVWAWRGGIAASLLLAVGSIMLFERVYPDRSPWTDGSGHVGDVVNTVRSDAASGAQALTAVGDVFQGRVAGPLATGASARPHLSRRPELPLGDTSVYDTRLTYRVAADPHSTSGAIGPRHSRAWARAVGAPGTEDGFVVTTARWKERPRALSDPRALRSDWEAGPAMRVYDDASALERSWWLRFWMNAQPAPVQNPER